MLDMVWYQRIRVVAKSVASSGSKTSSFRWISAPEPFTLAEYQEVCISDRKKKDEMHRVLSKGVNVVQHTKHLGGILFGTPKGFVSTIRSNCRKLNLLLMARLGHLAS